MFFSCRQKFDYKYIISTIWEYDSGFSVGRGDILMFHGADANSKLKNDTVLYEGKPRAIITKVDKNNYELEVTSLDLKEIGYYRDQAEPLEY